jgi:GntR family transcriptional regulator/MocR family aminotransferase
MGKAYHHRREVMDTALKEHGITVAGHGTYGGSAVWLRAPNGVDTTQLAHRLRGDGVLIESGAAFFSTETPPKEFFRLAYSSIPAEKIAPGVGLIARALANR